jgi:hypothetical protein
MAWPAHAEDDPFQVFWNQGRYLPQWRALAADSSGFRQQYAAFLGDEATALAHAAASGAPPEFSGAARALPAIDQIVAATAGRRVVMLNEAHVASRHRSFFAALMRALRPAGFTHIACEDFTNLRAPDGSSVMNIHANAPLAPQTGYYVHDPVYAEAIREAAELGYRFVAYDAREDQGVDGEAEAAATARREEAEANNFIANALADPSARVFVYVGYSHLREQPDGDGNVWFAQRLAAKIGIDPLTIEQAHLGSFGPHAADSPTAQMVLARFHPAAPIVIDEGGGRLHGARAADIAVYHPSLPDVRNRPGWLAADPLRRFARAPVRRPREALVLAQAVRADDPDATIPADQFLLREGQTHADFLLRPGRYRIRLETLSGFTPAGELTVTP